MSTSNLVTAAGTASTAKVRPDPVAQIRAAGKIIATGGHNSDMCIRMDQYGNEIKGNTGTPPHTKKYRKTNNMDPGQIMVHPGLQEGKPAFDLSYAFGQKNAAMRQV